MFAKIVWCIKLVKMRKPHMNYRFERACLISKIIIRHAKSRMQKDTLKLEANITWHWHLWKLVQTSWQRIPRLKINFRKISVCGQKTVVEFQVGVAVNLSLDNRQKSRKGPHKRYFFPEPINLLPFLYLFNQAICRRTTVN